MYIMVITVLSTFNDEMSNYYKEYSSLKVFDITGCFATFPVFIFSFTTQINLLQCFEELEKPTLRRMHKVLAKQHFICFTIYLFIGCFGYLSFPIEDESSDSYIQRYNPISHFEIMIVIRFNSKGVILLILVIFVAQPFNSLPTRESFEYLVCGSNKRQTPYWLHIVESIGRNILD